MLSIVQRCATKHCENKEIGRQFFFSFNSWWLLYPIQYKSVVILRVREPQQQKSPKIKEIFVQWSERMNKIKKKKLHTRKEQSVVVGVKEIKENS